MNRIRPRDVVAAYEATGLIPIRKSWTSRDDRGGCAFDAVARHRTSFSGHEMATQFYEDNYVQGFLDAWDADDPRDLYEKIGEKDAPYCTGFNDAMDCAEAVVRAFESIEVVESAGNS